MDEAAAKLRVALYSLPADLKEMKTSSTGCWPKKKPPASRAITSARRDSRRNRLRLQQEFDDERGDVAARE